MQNKIIFLFTGALKVINYNVKKEQYMYKNSLHLQFQIEILLKIG
jgi:hypothetical protein